MTRPLAVLAFAVAAASSARAQDFGQQWMDRVTREVMPDRGPLPTRALVHELYMGGIAYYDDNIHLRPDDEEAQTVIAPFIRLRVDYSERQLDAAGDVLASYKRYSPDEEFSDYEQRAFGRIRIVGPRAGAEIAAIVQNVSDPIDAVFADRAERLVVNAFPRASLELTNTLALEVSANAGYVSFWETAFETADNWNVRADFSVVGHLTNGVDLLGQAGVLAIRYAERLGPPDVDGFYGRGGLRGELTPVIHLTALAGWTTAESEDFLSGADGEEVDTADVAVNLRWQLAPKTTFWGDFTRQVAWGGLPDPFSVVNRATVIVESTLTEEMLGRVRGQADFVEGSGGIDKTFYSLAVSATYKLQPQVYLEGGVTWRWGEFDDVPGGYDYENTIVHLGLVVTN